MFEEGDSKANLNDVKQIYEKNELTKPLVPPKPKLAPKPKPRSFRRTTQTASSLPKEGALQKVHTYPKTTGSYHFDGHYFLPLKPGDSHNSSDIQDVFKPGSDFVEVSGAQGAKLTYMGFDESSNVEEQAISQDSMTAEVDSVEFSKGDINNEEKKSTNLNRQEQSSPQKRGRTNLNYEDIDESTITFRIDVQTPKEQDRPRSGPPEIPPRITKKISIKREKSSVKAETGNSSSEDEFGYQKYVQEEPKKKNAEFYEET